MASVGFRWLDILEKEFDKAFVDLDLSVGELDSEEPVFVYNVRQKLCTLSSCFAQLTHKAQTIFQNSAKIEAELIHMRAELVDSKAKRELLEQELHGLLLRLHSSQLALMPAANGGGASGASNAPDVNGIRRRLDDEIRKSPSRIVGGGGGGGDGGVEFQRDHVELKRLRCENAQLRRENVALRDRSLALNSEVYGAKLAAKYLDKELAGRIQQLQLLGREMRGDVRDKLWRQLESEILLQRHKTVVRECRRNSILNGSEKPTAAPQKAAEHFGDVRTVVVKRKPSQGLGISITGGREHGVPILISELEPNGPAASSGELYIGDAILAVNEKDLRQACHKEAVDVLKRHCEECRLQVQYVAADDSDNSLEEDSFHFRFFDGDDACDHGDADCAQRRRRNSFDTPTAPRTPESVSFQSGTTSRLAGREGDALKPYRVSPEIQKVIESLQTQDAYSFSSRLANDNAKDFLTGDDEDDARFVNANNEINRNTDAAPTTTTDCDDLILLDNRRSTNSLNSDNLSSPMQTSADLFVDSELMSTTDVASNDSRSPKTDDVDVGKFAAVYGSSETFSQTKSDRSLLNSSCDSSPARRTKTKKFKSKKYFGVKTLQSMFDNKRDGYTDISSNASDGDDERKLDDAATTYKYRTILAETSPQFEENVHAFLAEIFAKNFQTPDTPEATATTSRMGAKRYLRVGKALRLCANEDGGAPLDDYEQRREKLLARYVYNSNSLGADGEGNPDFGTPV